MPTQTTADIQVLSLKPEEVLSHLLDQPPEVIGEVLQWLDLRDLLSLRIANHRLHELVHHHEKSISARLCTRLRCQNTALQLPVKIHGLTNDLLFYIELHRRYSAIDDLSNLLCTHIVSRIRIQHPHPEKQVAEEWRLRKVARFHQRLFPALFLFNSFLECLHAVYLSGEEAFAQWDDDLLLSLHDVYDLDQQRIIEEFSPCDETTIKNVTVASTILLGVAKSKKLSLSSKSPRHPFASLKRILISSGLLPMADLLNPDHNDSDRRNRLILASDGIWKGKGRRPIKYTTPRLRSIHHLETQRVQSLGELPTHRGHKAKNWFAERQDLWDKAAFAVFQRLGCTGSFPPDTNQWIRCAMAEAYDAVYILADWQLPDPT
jgi:hypothetical protein